MFYVSWNNLYNNVEDIDIKIKILYKTNIVVCTNENITW